MFNKIEQVLKVYKRTLKDYVKAWNEIDNRIDKTNREPSKSRDNRSQYGEIEQNRKITLELAIMEKLLDINRTDKEIILEEIQDEIDKNK